MKRVVFLLMALCLATTGFSEQQTSGVGKRRVHRQGEASGYATRDATVLSMMGWGLGLAVGFAAICAIIDNHKSSSSNSHSH